MVGEQGPVTSSKARALMHKIHRYDVQPALPERLACLRDLAYNLRWTWDHETVHLFERLDADLWEESHHNPVLMLRRISQERLERTVEDEAFLANLDRACRAFREYMTEPGWFPRHYPEAGGLTIAYFCMEYGIAEALPVYSGGLGVLAGDHLKTASELDLPLVAIGLLYQKGYFSQYLNADGWQLEEYPLNDFSALPIQPVRRDDNEQVTIEVELAGRAVSAAVWLAQVGRISLYLLDTNLPQNDPADRTVTNELYGGGPEQRIRQEILLGIGGIRLLDALGIEPQICHMNEGHSAFLSLERVRKLMHGAGLTYQVARQVTGAGTLFTTHTPVPAGFDLFTPDLMHKYFAAYVDRMGLEWQDFLGRGRVDPRNPEEPFNVAALAIRHSPRRNAVSRLHRRVTARMMREAWREFPDHEVPVESITNGAHVTGWIAPEMAILLDRYLGPRWRDDPSDPAVWERAARIPGEELWRTHVRQRERLVAYARERLEVQLRRRGAPRRDLEQARGALRSDALTIGFARRFATYKRATLILREVDRLKALLLDERRPVQLIFAGKAHPRDEAGKEFIRQIVRFSQQEGVQHRLIFMEDYDLEKARMLVQGADVWLNTPRRPLEASGTSGMKAVMNGALNLSVLDGWWAEAARPGVGWTIGSGEEYADFEYQDRVESQTLYSILEQEVIPLFYDRGPDDLPHDWIGMMKNSMQVLVPAFSSTRMVKEYLTRFYLPAAAHHDRLKADTFARAREIVGWKEKVVSAWPEVAVVDVQADSRPEVRVGEGLNIEARVRLGRLSDEDVTVEAFYGLLRPDGDVTGGRGIRLRWTARDDGTHLYRGVLPARMSGVHGFSVRVLPRHEDVLLPNELALISWEK
jgi:glycogen phosphorylase